MCQHFLRDALSKQINSEASTAMKKLIPLLLACLVIVEDTVLGCRSLYDDMCIDLYMASISVVVIWARVLYLVKTSYAENDFSICSLNQQ